MTATAVRPPVVGMRRRRGNPTSAVPAKRLCDRYEVHGAHVFVAHPRSGTDLLCPGRTARHLSVLLLARPALAGIGIVPIMLELEVSCS